LRIRYSDTGTETYFVPISVIPADPAETWMSATPERVLCRVQWDGMNALLCDGTADDGACRALIEIISSASELYTRRGAIRATPTRYLAQLSQARGETPFAPRAPAEHSNTAVFYGDLLMLKLYRKLEPGVNPELEVLRYLTEEAEAAFERAPRLAGALEYVPFEGEAQTMAILQSNVENQGNAWQWMLEELKRFYEHFAAGSETERLGVVSAPSHTDELQRSAIFREAIGLSLDAAATLGRRTAELHLALAAEHQNPAFSPEPFSGQDLALVINLLRKSAVQTFKLLRENLSRLAEDASASAEQVLGREDRLMSGLERLESFPVTAYKTRVHGDYHLGQVLRVKNDYVIIDFEGEPGRPLAERRAKTSPLKDVAGMLRSFSYAAYTGLFTHTNRRPDELKALSVCARLWESEICSLFLKTYCECAKGSAVLPEDPTTLEKLLDIFLLDKALYELRYEINNRPAWARIPLQGILDLAPWR